MAYSMTGYGRYETIWNDVKLTVEVRSVNHRFCEIAVRLPRHLMLFEDRMKRHIQSKIHRGRVDVFVSFNTDSLAPKKLLVDWELAKAYCSAADQMRNHLNIEGEITVKDLMQKDELFQIEEEWIDVEQTFQGILMEGVEHATEQLIQMRAAEGETLIGDLTSRIEQILDSVVKIETFAPKVKENYANKLETRVHELIHQEIELDQTRLLTEIAIFADKSDVTEELTRLNSHCQQFLSILQLREPIGRKLDFLVQEMNREMNTIGSKANDIDMSQHVVELKSNLEKIKEQVQNIE